MAALASWLEGEGAARVPRERALEELAYYPSGTWLKAMSLGESALLADLTWLRAVQYYGECRQTDNTFRLLYHAFDVVTNFDPHHLPSYVFAGHALAQEGGQFENGIAILHKGRDADPAEWLYPFEIGFLHYVQKRDYLTASLWFQEAARKPDCPGLAQRFAAFASQRAGSRESAIALWQLVAENTDNPLLREKGAWEALEAARGGPEEARIEAWARRLLGGRRPARPQGAAQ
jgi:hypothetical protein